MEVPAWLAAITTFLGFLGGLFGDLLRRVVPTYVDLVQENASLRKERREQDDVIEGLEDTVRDEKEKG